MFKQSRKRIVAAIMSVLTLLWIGTLCVIYVFSYFELASTNREMLQEYAEQYRIERPQGGVWDPMRPFPDKGPHFDTNRFKLSTFYSVALSYDGQLLEIRNADVAVYSDEELERAARSVLNGREESGTVDRLSYFRMDKERYVLVSFMDNTILRDSMNTLFRYTLLFGSVALVILFFLAVYLAKRIVRPLEESYRKQKQFVSDAGHELKTPVSVVNANAELLSREIGDNPWLANIRYENERMGTLVAQLLELARTEQVHDEPRRLDFSRLVRGGALPFESVAYENGLVLQTVIPDGIELCGDPTQLGKLVSILLDNAISHSKKEGQILLELAQNRTGVLLSVTNLADPIPPERIEQLFERFYRADEARDGAGGHYGLGLAIAKAIAQSHRGRIDVNCFDGKVCFTVRFPKP